MTRREHAVLGLLADGLTADAIARRMSTSPATVRKHLQNLYAKLGTSDRLDAVIRGRANYAKPRIAPAAEGLIF